MVLDCVLTGCIVGEGSDIRNIVFLDTVLSDRVIVRGKALRMTVGEQTLIDME